METEETPSTDAAMDSFITAAMVCLQTIRPDLANNKEKFEELLEDLKDIYKRKGSTDIDIDDPKEYFKLMKEMSGRIDKDDSSSDDEPKKKGEGIKKGPGRPKKIVMKSYSSSSDEESEKMGMGLKVKRGRPTTKEGHKKCSCGSGLDVEPYQKFFQALKANTTLK